MLAVLAASDAELHDRLLGTALTLDAVGLLVVALVMWRRDSSGRIKVGIGWWYVWGQYAGWWAFVAALAVLLLRVDSPRPLEIAASVAFLALTVLMGFLLKQAWDIRDRPGRPLERSR